jgi:hypothetical protein
LDNLYLLPLGIVVAICLVPSLLNRVGWGAIWLLGRYDKVMEGAKKTSLDPNADFLTRSAALAAYWGLLGLVFVFIAAIFLLPIFLKAAHLLGLNEPYHP